MREDLRIGEIAAWLYRPEGVTGDVPCVVMAHGFSLTRHDGLPQYAEALAAAGAAVLLFDHRHLGDSGGLPRQRFRRHEQLADWGTMLDHARALEGVDRTRIVPWGFSFSGGHVTTIAARDHTLAAVIALCPFVSGLGRVLATPPGLVAWILPRAIEDVAGRHNLIPVTGWPGDRAAMSLPGEADGFARSVPGDSPWRTEISPGLVLTIALHRPLARAARITCPLWVGLGERDISTSKASVLKLADRAPKATLARYDADHFDPFAGELPQRIVADQIAFLRDHGVLST